MTQDKSREKSLLFLLSAVSRSLEVEAEKRSIIRKSIASMHIEDSGAEWIVSVETFNKTWKSVRISKDNFIFYPVKDKARYEVNPAVINKNSAQNVLLELFSELGVRVPGKKPQSTDRNSSMYPPANLFWVGIFSAASICSLPFLSCAILLAHLFLTTSKHYLSFLRRWSMITFIVLPAGFFLAYNNPRLDNLQIVFSQICLLYVFDFAIRFESTLNSKPSKTLVTVAAFTSLAFLVAVQKEVRLNLTITVVIALIGYTILRQNISKSLRSVLLLVHLGLCVFLIGAAIWANPFRVLLVPYLIYVALHVTFLGDNRNPSKLIFGAVCLSI